MCGERREEQLMEESVSSSSVKIRIHPYSDSDAMHTNKAKLTHWINWSCNTRNKYNNTTWAVQTPPKTLTAILCVNSIFWIIWSSDLSDLQKNYYKFIINFIYEFKCYKNENSPFFCKSKYIAMIEQFCTYFHTILCTSQQWPW